MSSYRLHYYCKRCGHYWAKESDTFQEWDNCPAKVPGIVFSKRCGVENSNLKYEPLDRPFAWETYEEYRERMRGK